MLLLFSNSALQSSLRDVAVRWKRSYRTDNPSGSRPKAPHGDMQLGAVHQELHHNAFHKRSRNLDGWT
eukprot:6473307-Amphidinium_carterae.1